MTRKYSSTGLLITVLRLIDWPDYHTFLRALSRRGSGSVPYILPSLTTATQPQVIATPVRSLHLTLEPPFPPALLDRLTNSNTSIRPRVLTLEFIRQPEPTVLEALLATHGMNTHSALTALALPTITTARRMRPRPSATGACLESQRLEHPYAAHPLFCPHLRHGSHAWLALCPPRDRDAELNRNWR
jgi:hypothetical protein